VGIMVTVILSGFSQVYLYFQVWANDPRTDDAFERELFDLGKLVNELDLKKNNYLIVASDIAFNEERTRSSLKTTEFAGYQNIHDFLFYHPFEALSSVECDQAQFVLQKSDEWLRYQFQQKCPDLELEKMKANGSRYEFWVLK
jgi:hypothetical protein